MLHLTYYRDFNSCTPGSVTCAPSIARVMKCIFVVIKTLQVTFIIRRYFILLHSSNNLVYIRNQLKSRSLPTTSRPYPYIHLLSVYPPIGRAINKEGTTFSLIFGASKTHVIFYTTGYSTPIKPFSTASIVYNTQLLTISDLFFSDEIVNAACRAWTAPLSPFKSRLASPQASTRSGARHKISTTCT